MKNSLLLTFCLLASAATAAPTDKPSSPPAIDEHSRLVQEYQAERAKYFAERDAVKARAKQARDGKNARDLKDAQDELVKLEQKFAQRNAELIRKLKDDEAAKNPRSHRPTTGG